MTLNDILVAALAQLERGHDSQTLDVWRERLSRFANDGVMDLCAHLKPTLCEKVYISNNRFFTQSLSRDCVKILSVNQSGRPLRFVKGGSGSEVLVNADGEADVTYVFAPREMTSPTDVPELPLYYHALVVTYVVARERSAGDPHSQQGSGVYFGMYEEGKRRLRSHMGDIMSYRLINRW